MKSHRPRSLPTLMFIGILLVPALFVAEAAPWSATRLGASAPGLLVPDVHVRSGSPSPSPVNPPLQTSTEGPVSIPVAGAIVGVHDPSIARDGSEYYLYSSGGWDGSPGIGVRRSSDLVHWDRLSDVFDSLPKWVHRAVPGATNIWAPDLSYWKGLWHLYYAVSTSAQRTSAIGLATNITLDPASPRYAWIDHGEVVGSHGGLVIDPAPHGLPNWNAIDPSVELDQHGQPWMNWGSYAGGIFLGRLTPDGFLDRSFTPVNLAKHLDDHLHAIEGSVMAWHGGWWYLFASYDVCCQGTQSDYNVRVGRARSMAGPFVDAHGISMLHGGATYVIRGYGQVNGPGGEGVFQDASTWWLVVHEYNGLNHGLPQLGIYPISWSKAGWPTARGWSLAVPAIPLRGMASYDVKQHPGVPIP